MASKQPVIAERPPAEPTTMAGELLNIIARAANDPNTDVDKLDRLLAMQERILAREAEQAFNESMRAAQDELRPIIRNKINPETKSKYADLEALADEVDPVAHRHGFSDSFGTFVSELPDHYGVLCYVSHRAGHTREYRADIPVDMTGPKGSQNKTRTHGFGSSMSYGRRYLKLLVYDVKLTDDDGNAAARRLTIDDAQIAAIQNMASASGADLARFCRFFKIEAVPELPASRFNEAVTRLSEKLRQAEAAK